MEHFYKKSLAQEMEMRLKQEIKQGGIILIWHILNSKRLEFMVGV